VRATVEADRPPFGFRGRVYWVEERGGAEARREGRAWPRQGDRGVTLRKSHIGEDGGSREPLSYAGCVGWGRLEKVKEEA
jgi:hypothetical protein